MTVTEQPAVLSADDVFADWLGRFADVVATGDAAGVAQLFVEDGYWKDILALTWAFRTYHGREMIRDDWARAQQAAGPTAVRRAPDRPAPRIMRRSTRRVVEGFFDFDTVSGRATAFVRLLPDEPEGTRAWVMLTALQELHGAEERVGARRPTGEVYSTSFAGDNWLDQRRRAAEYENSDPEVVIVGGGQSGLILAARLGHMGVDCLVLEKNARVGDNWRHRYHSLTLHNEVWANNMPYLHFPETWPTFVPKDMIAGWLESYAEFLELNVWTEAEVGHADYNVDSARWTVQVTRADGTLRTIRAPHLVLATGGVSGVPNVPRLPGLAEFAGEVIHSSQFTSGSRYEGRRALVFGTGNSGHDVAQDLYCNGAAAVTMVQRSPTCVVSLVPSGTMVYALYSEGPSAEDTDLIMSAQPYSLFVESSQWITKKTCALDKDLLSRLNAAGFETDFEPDGTGFYMKYLRRGGGYYINVGCSDLIADGKIGLVQGRDITTFGPDGLQFQDGTSVEADLVVLATGYENQQEGVRRLVGDDIADRVGPIWGFDENHVMRNMWQRTAQPGFWLMGGSLIDCRLYSRFLALQITAELRGVDSTAL